MDTQRFDGPARQAGYLRGPFGETRVREVIVPRAHVAGFECQAEALLMALQSVLGAEPLGELLLELRQGLLGLCAGPPLHLKQAFDTVRVRSVGTDIGENRDRASNRPTPISQRH